MKSTTRCIVCDGGTFRHVFSKQGFDFVRCQSCQVMRLDPIPTLDELRKHYAERTSVGNYDLVVSRERDGSIADSLEYIARQVGPQAGKKLLDIGCFDGKLIDLAEDRFGWSCWGIELNEDAAEVARKRHGERVRCTTVESYDPPPGVKFDVITAIAVVEHMRDPRILFEKVGSWLSDGGTCILELPNATSLLARLMSRYWPPIAAPEHIWYLGPPQIKTLCDNSNLEFVKSAQHWKRLSIGYVYRQLQYFGPEIRRVMDFFVRFLPQSVLSWKLQFYVGEMYVVIRRK